jgi:hypothetical protein
MKPREYMSYLMYTIQDEFIEIYILMNHLKMCQNVIRYNSKVKDESKIIPVAGRKDP